MVTTVNIALSRLRMWLKASWQFFTGVIVALVAFATNFHDFKQPEVSVEITAVTTTSSEPVDLVRVPELSTLREALGVDTPFGFRTGAKGAALPPDEIDRQLLILNNQSSTQASDIDRIERQLASAVSNTLSEQESILRDLAKDIQNPFSREESVVDIKKLTTVAERVDSYMKTIRKTISDKKKEQADYVAKLKEAERQWSNHKLNVLPNRARLVVICALGNRGAGATSLKPQALFRANLGDGNYLDFPMKLNGYDNSADIASLQAQTYKVIRFQSDEVQSMTPADRDRFKSFLGNASPATLFVSDVRGNTYPSNSVPFSPGVYEQKVYDSLKQFASKNSSKTFSSKNSSN